MNDERSVHAVCGATAKDEEVTHFCSREYAHSSSHECNCGRFWLNSWEGIR